MIRCILSTSDPIPTGSTDQLGESQYMQGNSARGKAPVSDQAQVREKGHERVDLPSQEREMGGKSAKSVMSAESDDEWTKRKEVAITCCGEVLAGPRTTSISASPLSSVSSPLPSQSQQPSNLTAEDPPTTLSTAPRVSPTTRPTHRKTASFKAHHLHHPQQPPRKATVANSNNGANLNTNS